MLGHSSSRNVYVMKSGGIVYRLSGTANPLYVSHDAIAHINTVLSRLLKKAVSKAAASEGPRRTSLGYVEGLNDARTKLADFFSSLLGWEERAPTEDSIGTAEILAGL